jgi:hypothetical protein
MEQDREDLSEVEEFREHIIEAHGDGPHIAYLVGVFEQLGAEGYTDKIAAYESKLVELLRAHGEIGAWPTPGNGLVVVAAPKNPKTYQNLVNALQDDKIDKAVELEKFALNCVVYPVTAEGKPDRAAVKRIFAAKPAFALKVAGRAQELAGSDIVELGKA